MFLNTSRHIREGLTRYNYFPNQKDGVGELPPCFSTRQFTPEIVELLVKQSESRERRILGYDQVEYLVTRHNNVPRSLGLIHPRAYADLSSLIYDNWEKLHQVTLNGNSMIKPAEHLDGRIMIMNYEDLTDRVQLALEDGFGKRFRVHSDISSCFHSIYSHSIPWAAIGFNNAKKQYSSRSRGQAQWFDNLDKYQRKSKRNETQGIAIGPATSSIIVELILGCVDRVLLDDGFEFRRYIDDYVCYCETYESAQKFIQQLGKELGKYKLNLNLHKTKVIELPEPLNDSWISVLAGALPSNFIDKEFNRRQLLLPEIIHYFDTAVQLSKSEPDGSVIKYAVGSVIHNLDDSAVEAVLDYIINLCWHYPALLPYLDTLLSHERAVANKYSHKLNSIIAENARNRRSDGMAWPLYYLKKFSLPVTTEAYAETIKSEDCIALLSLYSTGSFQAHIIEFANGLLCKTLYEKDQYWVLLYQLFRDGVIKSPYDDGVFELLREQNVSFVPKPESFNVAEKYCQYLQNPFLSEDEMGHSYEEWLSAQ